MATTLDHSDLEAIGRGPFSTTTRPSDTQVDAVIARMYQQLQNRVTSAGITVDDSQEDEKEIVLQLSINELDHLKWEQGGGTRNLQVGGNSSTSQREPVVWSKDVKMSILNVYGVDIDQVPSTVKLTTACSGVRNGVD